MSSWMTSPRLRGNGDWVMALGGALVAVVLTHLLFGRFFPGPNGVGHDYAGGMTGYLAEYYWSLSEGPWIPPWFTPAFCGGIPLYADPVNSFFSLPGFLLRLAEINPLMSAYASFLIAVGIGFLGTFFFVRRRLFGSSAAALLAGLFFALNGFLASRMLIGHFIFHGMVLMPALALWLTSDSKAAPSIFDRVLAITTSSLAITYWVYSGGGALVVPFALGTLLLVTLALLRGSRIRETLIRGCGASVLAIALAASKLNAAVSYMASFPRSDYLLPGYKGFIDTLQVIIAALFTTGENIAQYSQERLTNVQWLQDRHELEYGVTVIPLLLIGLAVAIKFLRPSSQDSLDSTSLMKDDPSDVQLRGALIVVAMIVILAIPVALNTYGESWNALLKSLPLVGSSSALMRWFVVYIPFFAVVGALAVDRATDNSRQRAALSIMGAIGVVIILGTTDRRFYEQQVYDPAPVIEAFEAAKKNPASRPVIESVGAFVDEKGNILLPINRQDLIVRGVSQIACYVPIFGYRLESFPFRTLRPGSIFEADSEGFNMKNPACFVFPKENNCKVGDHFPVARRSDLEKFAGYRSFSFEKSTRQKIADIVSLITLLTIFGAMTWAIAVRSRLTQ
jgi:hypothetical protein